MHHPQQVGRPCPRPPVRKASPFSASKSTQEKRRHISSVGNLARMVLMPYQSAGCIAPALWLELCIFWPLRTLSGRDPPKYLEGWCSRKSAG